MKNIERVIILILLSISLSANDSFYTTGEVSKCKMIDEDERSSKFICPAPEGYKFKIIDSGGPMLQFSIEKGDMSYEIFSNQEAKVIEWRTDNKKNVIGVIVRVFEYVDMTNLASSKSSSALNIISLVSEPKLIKTTKSNLDARKILDKYQE